ncbi:putative Exonuclease Kem1 [Taphrina deformans PYCC 5710]|uniref:5'-3' exoribonuclease 1 n=1 Tax=Taphrina deformans (strain PYCC 5710 / ATCC 11124 / CBS 356.35 / IMI 108563 / JCM 9778 / NBRC 8474) TaxID=1097556 RepID=R4X9X0_TAPDE|nr:putative Exonuclease Kem1 [Taphrina deformans PYCC 5710]|eukprot:CCG82598.1 putative Exonuclease Kem1 [Taphrina deformans PYCC 5710]
MGIPKFFRWMSERYPLCSQLIEPNSIPEFDNLYLDMNGIIHNSTHKGDYGISGSLTEDKMFMAIFNYIEHLFATIKPKKLFFMAIDGCAPRAKMNQQRSRRFRTAKDAHDARQAAIKKGEELPKEEPFDSNCITPGTVFMAKLSKQLQYFVNKKVSEDSDWRGVTVVLSGHDVPGEGEHKIMEYIRAAKAQDGYDPNVRECLYGLDADLIMLGLLSHEPHFCLLREEVTFGPVKAGAKTKELDAQNFFLMHLSLLREYLELEFQELRATLPFEYDLERIIDDFILMAFFVGNDFLPNLPNLHINEGALALMYKVYKETIPLCGGYMNDNGVINRERLGKMLEGLEKFEKEYFEAESHDASYFKTKDGGHLDNIEEAKAVNRLLLTQDQKKVFNQAKGLLKKQDDGSVLVKTVDETMQKFVEKLCADLSLSRKEVAMEEDGVIAQFSQLSINNVSARPRNAVQEAIARYSKAPVVQTSIEEAEAEMQKVYDEKFDAWRNDYYKEKLGFGVDDEPALTKMAENYCEGLQWVLYYYYHGVVSWGWYYGYHYSPKISDVRKGLTQEFKFDLGRPFKPFEQLMGVLPERSKKLVPECLQELMVEDNSPIKDFYPNDFPLDMNGKKADWEAVVKIPFIDEQRLLKAMDSKAPRLTADERARNGHGLPVQFIYDARIDQIYPSSLPGLFPDLRSHCHVAQYELPSLIGKQLTRGLTEGVVLGADSLAGFPSLHTLPFTGALDFHGINVFQRDSKNETMVITLDNMQAQTHTKTEDFARERIGKSVFVGWPYLKEAQVVAVSDELFRYEFVQINGTSKKLVPIPHHNDNNQWPKLTRRIQDKLSKKLGIVTGPINIILHVANLKGLMRTEDGSFVKEFLSDVNQDTDFPLQCIVNDVVSVDSRYVEREALDIKQEFPVGQKAFFLGEFNYGRPARVMSHSDGKINILVSALKVKEADFGHRLANEALRNAPYYPAPAVCKVVGMSALCLSKLTSSFTVVVDDDRTNLGLNLKFEGKKLKVLGFSRRNQMGWEYSDKAVALLQDYKRLFPEFIAQLERKARNDMFVATDFYPSSEAKSKIKEISSWLKSVATKSFEKVPLEAQELDQETISRIEEAANDFNSKSLETKPTTINSVPRKALLKPEDAASRLKHQTFVLGDRITYVADSGKVPIATRGTVVGVHKDSLDIVFDAAFMSGTVLGGRCSEYRGMTVSYFAVLNISRPTVLATSRAGKTAVPVQGSQHVQGSGIKMGQSQQKLFARNAPHPNGQYYDNQSDKAQNNHWQHRSNNRFMSNMLQTKPSQNGAIPGQFYPQQQTRQISTDKQVQPSGPQSHQGNGFARRGGSRGRGGRGRGGATSTSQTAH